MERGLDRRSSYEIRVAGALDERWSSWFAGLEICREPSGDTLLCGMLADQAALHGVLARIHDLNLVLVSVNRQPMHVDPQVCCCDRIDQR